jgi:hypothetical protein
VTEAEFTDAVIDLAHFRGWLCTHFRPAWTGKGFRTALQGDAGFPDLVLARRGVVIHAELKTEKGRVTRAQAAWATALGGSYRLWRPSDMDEIARELM